MIRIDYDQAEALCIQESQAQAAELIRHYESSNQSLFIFGYGSLLWRPDFKFEANYECTVRGYRRRFHQGSPDHRGTLLNLGRVVTLEKSNTSTEEEEEHTYGLVFLISKSKSSAVLSYLFDRESRGFSAIKVSCELNEQQMIDGELTDQVSAITFAADHANHFYLGPASHAEIALQIFKAKGKSGENSEYLWNLYFWLNSKGRADVHVSGIVNEIQKLSQCEKNMTT